jgi:hypothetical protein
MPSAGRAGLPVWASVRADHVPDLVAGAVVLGLTAALDELEHTCFAEVELDPARADSQLSQPGWRAWCLMGSG